MGVCLHCGGKLTGETDAKARQRYLLRRRRGLWQVVFDGEEAQFKHEKGRSMWRGCWRSGGRFMWYEQ